MTASPHEALRAHAAALGFESPWLEAACILADERFAQCPHGDFPRWRDALERLPGGAPFADLDRAAPRLGKPDSDPAATAEALMALHPWRKGPLTVHGIEIDTEWRSDLKWARIGPEVDLGGKRVLDVGCGNGYYGWRMLAAGADLVIGIDPTWVYVMQWLACWQASGELPNYVLPLGIEDLPAPSPNAGVAFDTVFSMGVLYHRRQPLSHLVSLHALLEPGGELVLETLVLPDAQAGAVLHPKDRYARMRNVWAVAGCARLLGWVSEAGFEGARVVDVSQTSTGEQRSTHWMTFESLDKALDPLDPALTVEGHPAPRRAIVIARRPR